MPVYEIYHIYDEDIIQTSADYSRAGKTIEVEVDLYNDYSNLINSVKEIKVTDSKGKSIKVTKTSDNTYEFTMPKSQVNIQAICDYNLTTDSEGVYYISDIDDLVAFARIVEAGQTDANAKVVAKSINYRDYSGYWAYSNVGLIGKNAPYTGTFDGNGAEETGKAAVEIDKQIALKYEGKLTDNKVQQMMSEFKPTQDLHGMNAKYIYQNALQSSVFSHFADIDGNWNGLSVADVFGDKEIKVGYVNGWLSTSQNMAKIFIVLSLVIILLIAPVFSGEYGGVDNIILTSKYGKTKCATAKVLASLLSAVFITTLVVIFNLLIAVAIYGTEGLDCSILFAPIDFLEGYIPFNITCGTVLKYQILLAFMSAISVTGIVLILSAVCKSQMIAFVISAAIHVIPIMLPISETSALYRIIVLMPLFYSQYISIMSVEQMHNGMLYAVWSIPVAIALVVIGSIISHKAFSKHQVR